MLPEAELTALSDRDKKRKSISSSDIPTQLVAVHSVFKLASEVGEPAAKSDADIVRQ